MRELNAQEIRILIEESVQQRVSIDKHYDILTIEVSDGRDWLVIAKVILVDRVNN